MGLGIPVNICLKGVDGRLPTGGLWRVVPATVTRTHGGVRKDWVRLADLTKVQEVQLNLNS